LAVVHAWQSPVQALLQQTPSTQLPDWHWLPVVHTAPFAAGSWQAPALQMKPVTQSELPAQGFLHAPTEQAYGAQSTLPLVAQVPEPSQVWVLSTEPWQSEEPHGVPEAKSWQAPEPLQLPVWPQLFWACAAHSLSGSAPAAMGPQVPSEPEPFLLAVQALHRPVQAEPQQTPSTQKVEEHSLPAPHAAPSTLGAWQVLPTQT
jgi:hypothetical protein